MIRAVAWHPEQVPPTALDDASDPPFDPEALGLDRHQVFLTASEAVFIFESELGAGALESLLE